MPKDSNEVPLSDDCFPYEYIDDEANKKFDKTKGQLAGNEMEKENKHYVESTNHDPDGLKSITTEIDKFLIDRKYINFFIIMYMQWSKDDGSTSPSQKLIIPCLPSFEKLDLSQFQLYIENSNNNSVFYVT